jgi:hypothetical protein
VYPGIRTPVRKWTVVLITMAVVGCGGGGNERSAATTPEPVAAAGSAEECQELWNANAHGGGAGQKAPEDYLAEVAPTDAVVAFVNDECVVMAPVNSKSRRIYVWVARGGRAPYGQPSQDTIPAGRDLRFNAQATEEGKLE